MRIPFFGKLFRRLWRVANAPPDIDRLRSDVLELSARSILPMDQLRSNQGLFALALAERELAERPAAERGPVPARAEELRRLTGLSSIARQDQFMTPEYLFWCREMKKAPVWHRKRWEHVVIAQALWQEGMLRAGRRGCVFGVGAEPLPALFAKMGCEIVATDAPEDAVAEQDWGQTGQFAASLDDLNAQGVAPAEVFRANVSFRPVDMRAIPDDLTGFDFLWSSCAFEHLGGLEAGIEFVLRSLRCLRSGGVAVHTTEYNCTSNDATIDSGSVVSYRRRDIEDLGRRLAELGADMEPPCFDEGNGVLDGFVPAPPYGLDRRDDPMLKIALGEHVTTSIALIIRKRP